MNVEKNETRPDAEQLLEFVYRLGQAYLACGEQTAKVEINLRRIVNAYGMRRPRVVAFPTALLISLHDGDQERVTIAEGPTQSLRLDQIADVYHLGEEASAATITPAQGLQRLNGILRARPRFGPVGAIVGHAVLSVGLAMVLLANFTNLAAAAALGAVVGLVKSFTRDRPVLSVPLPVVVAAIVSTCAFLAIEHGWAIDPFQASAPALITFLPGAMLTLAMVELAYGDMVSGSSRLTTGFVQLLLLAFGLAAGAVFVGYLPTEFGDTVEGTAVFKQPPWVPWLGVLVFASGVYLHFSAPRGSFLWMLLVLVTAFAAQQLSARFFGNLVSGFFGMLLATPLAYVIELKFRGPPAMVTFLPTFWLLVPGALGLLSVKRMLSDRAAGLDGMITTVFVFAAIALGTLMGASLYKGLSERFGDWRLQLGRVGRYFRR